MNILNNIKMDVLVACHPTVLKFKRESKALHKELKSKQVTLMQCQEIIAKQHGFNNYHHFMQMIKKYYTEGLESIPFIVTPKLEKNENFLMGYDINFGHYKWQDESSLRSHQLVIGEHIFDDYDTFLALQAIEKNNEVLFINGRPDSKLETILKQKATQCGREKDFKVVDKNNEKIYNHFSMSSGALSELIMSLVNAETSQLIKGKVIALLSGIVMALIYKRDTDKTVLSIEKIKQSLELDQLIEIYKENLPYHIKKAIKDYFNILPGFTSIESISQLTQQQHNLLTDIVKEVLDKIISLNILSNNSSAIHMDSLLHRDKSIYLFNAPDNFHQMFLTNFLKKAVYSQLGSSIEEVYGQKDKQKNNLSLYNIFFREVSVCKDTSMILAQLRGLGYSVTFSYESIDTMRNLLQLECFKIIANLNTKIIGANEKEVIDYLKIYNNYELMSDKLNEYVNTDNKKNNYVWVIKKDDIAQISYKNNNIYLNI